MPNFDAINTYYNTMMLTKTTGSYRVADKPLPGGAFAPNTQETIDIMRVNLENNYDKSFIVKYKAMMTNRLNTAVQNLKNAYQALLYNCMTQDVSEASATSVATDYKGNSLAIKDSNGTIIVDPFKSVGGAYDDTRDGTPGDGIDSFDGSIYFNKRVPMRNFEAKGAAMDIANDVKITFRTQEQPPDGSWIDTVVTLMGDNPPPFSFKQKVAEYATTIKAGGFFTAVNYLYNFNPRQIKYTYATSYTQNTSEAGSRGLVDGVDAVLFNSKMTHADDATDQMEQNERLQWLSTNGNEGYMSEIDVTKDSITSEFKTIYKRKADYVASLTSQDIDPRIGQDNGDTNATNISVTGTKLDPISVVSGIKIDTDENYTINSNFVNHYQVLTRTIDYNGYGDGLLSYDAPNVFSSNPGNITARSGITIWESSGIDGSLTHKEIDSVAGISDTELMPGSGKVAKYFTPEFINNVYSLDKFNNVSIAGNYESPYFGNIEITKTDGVERAIIMSKGAIEYKAPETWEINAAEAVPTEWYQSEVKYDTAAENKIWFPYISGSKYASDKITDNNYTNQTINLRRAFNLTDSQLNLNKDAINIQIKSNNSTPFHLMINGHLISTDTSGGANIRDYLIPGPNVVVIQATENSPLIDSSVEGISVSVVGTAGAWFDGYISSMAAVNGGADYIAGTEKMETQSLHKASFWQAQVTKFNPTGVAPDATEIKYLSDPLWTGTTMKRNQTGEVLNPFMLGLMEAINDPKLKDVFKLGLFKDIVVTGTGNTPGGGVVSGSMTLKYDIKTCQISVIQDRFTAKQG